MIEKKWNEDWQFWEDKNSFALVWSTPNNAKKINLPHDAMIENDTRPESLNGNNTGYHDGSEYVYVKKLSAPEEYREKTVTLKFEGIYMNAAVYVNEQLAGKCPYGYSTFYVELNDFLVYGQENEIRVQVKTGAMTNSRWYSGSGIYRDVYLLISETSHIAPDGVQIATLESDGATAVLEIKTELKNRHYATKHLRLLTKVFDDGGTEVGALNTPVTLYQNASEIFREKIVVSNPKTWSEDTPTLYTCVTTLMDDEKTLDEHHSAFGIRVLSLDAKNGLRVNGKSVKLRGACVHHDNGILGAITFDEVEYRKISILKKSGFNAVRMSHHPMSQAMLRACDALGVYVMDESFDMWTRSKSSYDYGLYFDQWWKFDVSAMVKKDYNHPCVIMYSLGNEIPEIGTHKGVAICKEMAEYVKTMDAYRYTLVSINGVFAAGDKVGEIVADVLKNKPNDVAAGEQDGNVNNFLTVLDSHIADIVVHPIISERIEKACATLDIAGYNYMTARYIPDAEKYPNRVMVGSETYPPEIAKNWEIVKKLPSVIGDFTWTGWDYIGEAGVGVPSYGQRDGGFGALYPCQLAYCGDIDITGFRRPASYYREIVFGLRKAPYIAVQNPAHHGEKIAKTPWIMSDTMASWTYEAMEGKPVIIEVYCASPEVELVKNGQSLGKKPCGAQNNFLAYFETTCEPGTLSAYAYEGQEKIGQAKLTSAKGKLTIQAEEEPLPNSIGESDFTVINISLKGENGEVYTDRDCEIGIELVDAKLLGFGSADPKSTYNYTQNITKTFGGRAQAIVQKTGDHFGVTVFAIQ